MSTVRVMPGGHADRDTLPKGPNGRHLCRWCSLEVPKGRLTFCSDYCVEEWRLRTDPGYLRQKVLDRDKGVCAVCHIDCLAEWRSIMRLRGVARHKKFLDWNLSRRFRRSLWDADHIVSVVEGGGECDLSNLRTLCLKCHRAATMALRERRSRASTATDSADEIRRPRSEPVP
jgi:5-methylcytosine-specific restriction protein A